MEDLVLLLSLIAALSLGLSAFFIQRYYRLKKELVKTLKDLKIKEQIFWNLPICGILMKKDGVVAVNKCAMEILGVNPKLDQIERIFIKKGKKVKTMEIDLSEDHRLILWIDITESESLKEAYKMALSYLSHELKTPLAVAVGYSERIEDQLGKSDLPPDWAENFYKLRNALVSLEKLLKRLFSGIEYLAKEVRMEKERVSMNEVLEEAIFWAQPLAEDKKIRLEVKTQGNFYVLGSSHLLTQAVFNVLENAIKVSPFNGVIVIELYPLGENKTCLSIRDFGPGIAPDRLSLLGMPFMKFGNTEGTGLGLFITKRIVEAHGGELRFSLPSDRGLEVKIILPESLGVHSV